MKEKELNDGELEKASGGRLTSISQQRQLSLTDDSSVAEADSLREVEQAQAEAEADLGDGQRRPRRRR